MGKMQRDKGADDWRQAPGFDGWYDVSSTGLVRSWHVKACHRRADEPTLLGGRVTRGYVRFKLTHPVMGKVEVHASHLVLASFTAPRPHGMVADHINGDTLDNRPENLRWITSQSNIAHARALGLHGNARPSPRDMSALSNGDIQEIRELRAKGLLLREIASLFGITFQSVSLICRNKVWKETQWAAA